MNKAARTLLRPPPMKLRPRHWPDWRVHGARPHSAAMLRRSSVPSSGNSASSVRADHRADSGHAAQQVVLGQPRRRTADRGVEVVVGLGQFAFQRLDQPLAALMVRRWTACCARLRSAVSICTICRRRATRSARSRVPRRAADAPAAWSPRRSARSPPHRSGRSWRACPAPARRPAPAPG